MSWDLIEGYEHGVQPPGYELFTSSSSTLHSAPAGLTVLNLVGGIVGRELVLLESCPALAQLRRIRLWTSAAAEVTLEHLVDRSTSLRHLESIEVRGSGRLPRERVDALRADLERALPTTKLDGHWDSLVGDPGAPSNLPDPVDSASRNSEARIDAIARWISGEKK